MFSQIKEVFAYKQMLISSVKKELRSRYRGSVLGFLWTFINPLMQLVVYSFVFRALLRSDIENYTMFVFIGLLPWIYFSSSLQISTTCIAGNANLVKKIYFPRMILPITVSVTGLINYIFGLAIAFPALLITGVRLTPHALFLPVIMAIQFLMVTGICMILSSLYVYFRDLEHIISILTMVWFYLTPVIYSADMFTDYKKDLLMCNPMTHFVTAYRDVLMYGTAPDWASFLAITIFSAAIFLIGALIFSKLQRNFAEEL